MITVFEIAKTYVSTLSLVSTEFKDICQEAGRRRKLLPSKSQLEKRIIQSRADVTAWTVC